MDAIIQNLSPLPRSHWVTVTFPRAFESEALFAFGLNQYWRAVRGATVGNKTVYRINCRGLGGNQRVVGRLVNESSLDASKFRFHPWVSDDFAALLPKIRVRKDGFGSEVYWSQMVGSPVLLEQSDAHMLWTVTSHVPECGLVFQWWAELLSDDPVVKCWGKITWADRRSPAQSIQINAIELWTHEFFVLDFAKAHGVPGPVETSSGWGISLCSDFVFQDGASLPLSGVMLTHKPKDADDVALANLLAAAQGPVVGAATCWDGNWGANQNVPRYDRSALSNRHAIRESEWQQFLLRSGAGWNAPRPLGLGKTPWQTGDQEDFGATKGTYVVTEHDPRFLRVMQYSAYADLLRGINYGVSAAARPNWVTWSGRTHFNQGVSPDRLGKVGPDATGTGWAGYDDEHRSQNTLVAYALLSDDPLAQDILRTHLELDEASYRTRYPSYGQGAARAQGRLAGAFAQSMTAVPPTEAARWRALLDARMTASSQVPSMNVPGATMHALAVGAPDARKPIYRDGVLAHWVSLWEHGLAAVGMYSAVKANSTDVTRAVLTKVCQTLRRFGFFKHDGVWFTTHDILWSNGQPPPGGMRPTNEVSCAPNAGSVGSWTFAGILVAREVLGPDAELNEYIASVTQNKEAMDRRTAEWWAAVRWS